MHNKWKFLRRVLGLFEYHMLFVVVVNSFNFVLKLSQLIQVFKTFPV